MKNFYERQKTTFVFILLACLFQAVAQKSPETVIVMLSDQKIADVNLDNDKYIAGIKDIIDITEKEFINIQEGQSVNLLVTSHKSGPSTFEFYSNPKIDKAREDSFIKKLKALKAVNTKIVDFSILLNIKRGKNDSETDFVIETDIQKRKTTYEKANLKEKYELNMKWAAENALPVLAAYQTIVDAKFAGVKGFGEKVEATNFTTKQDVARLTSANPDYWRAVMEMEIANQLIPITKIFMLVSQGELDYTKMYADIITMYSRPESVSHEYLSEFNWRMNLFNDELIAEIEKGIAEHDKSNYDKAIAIYNEVLKIYPNSAWALYELYYSKNALDIQKEVISVNDRKDWDNAKIAIYSHNPLYNMDVRASNGKEAYLLFRRQEMSTLFKNNDNTFNDVFEYADIALDLGVYDFAAQLFWLKFTFDESDQDKALHRYLYCLEKLDVKQLKSNFKGNYDKIFEKLNEQKEQTMKESAMYKAFKK